MVTQNLQATLGPNHEPTTQWVSDITAVRRADITHTKQSWWADAVHNVVRDRLCAQGSLRDRV